MRSARVRDTSIFVTNTRWPLMSFARRSQARECGLLGQNILGTGFSFDLHIQLGAGAFVCGEETALMSSIEGRVGEPQPRPPFPAEQGLWGQPTNINNVKTWASVPHDFQPWRGLVCAVGDREQQRDDDLLAGRQDQQHRPGRSADGRHAAAHDLRHRRRRSPTGKKFKAVQTGGPSGGCIPESLLDLPLDYENLTGAGSMMGSGGMIVMDEKTCMVDVARYFPGLHQVRIVRQVHSPAGKARARCTRFSPGITTGKGEEGDIELLEEMGTAIKDGSLCGLGKTAPNPVLSTDSLFPR